MRMKGKGKPERDSKIPVLNISEVSIVCYVNTA